MNRWWRCTGLLGILGLGTLAPGTLAAQASVYSVVGPGFAVDPLGVRARALGGGIAATDPRSAVNPAAVVAYRRLTVLMTSATAWRDYEIGETEVNGLRLTQFPFAVLGGDVPGTSLAFAASFATYLDRSYDVTAADTIELRGSLVPVNDRVASRGAVVDARGTLGWAVSPGLSVGLGVHVLSGSARLRVEREFGDTAYGPVRQRVEDGFSGLGVSLGLLASPAPWLRFGLAARRDGQLRVSRDGERADSLELPVTLAGGVLLAPHPAIRWSSSIVFHSWSDAAPALARAGRGTAFDAWSIGSGVEIGAPDGGAVGRPLRVGVRYARLPFSPSDDQPEELVLALGSGVRLAANRAALDLTLERVFRSGAGASERAWQLSVALLLQP